MYNNKQEAYLSGEKVWGDDFTYDQIVEWYNDEKQGYSNIYGAKNIEENIRENEIHVFYGYKYLGDRTFEHAMVLGGADGRDVVPILDKIEKLTIIEIDKNFHKKELNGTPVNYAIPSITGELNYPDGSFDLIMISSVLHHIPNVTFVINELKRCLSKDGLLIISEPIVMMGGLYGVRDGLTLRERGIPLQFFEVNTKDMNVELKAIYNHALTRNVFGPILKKTIMNSSFLLRLDRFLCDYIAFTPRYYNKNKVRRALQGASIYYVLKKRAF